MLLGFMEMRNMVRNLKVLIAALTVVVLQSKTAEAGLGFTILSQEVDAKVNPLVTSKLTLGRGEKTFWQGVAADGTVIANEDTFGSGLAVFKGTAKVEASIVQIQIMTFVVGYYEDAAPLALPNGTAYVGKTKPWFGGGYRITPK